MTAGDILSAHTDFWNGKGLLVHSRPYVAVHGIDVPIAGCDVATESMYLTPDMLAVEDFMASPAGNGVPDPSPVAGDVFRVKGAFKLPWMEAIMGCPIRLLPESGAAWAEKCLTDASQIGEVRPRLEDNPWLQKLVEFTRTLADGSDGSYFATHTTMRGPVDMADAMLGTEQLLLCMMDEPDRIRRLLEICTEVFIETARAQWAVIPPTDGGYVCRYGVWAPGHVTRSQADAAAMMSPQTYRHVVKPHDVRVLRAFDYTIMHTHSGYPHLAEAFGDQDVPSAIQVGRDEPPFGPPVSELIPGLKRILERKPLIFHGLVTEEEADILANELPPTGLFLDLTVG